MKNVLKSMLMIAVSLVFLGVNAQSAQQWYNDAQNRIETIRKGDFQLTILDKDGNPYDGTVNVRMMKHEFSFGVGFDFYEGEIIVDIPTETQWAKAAMYKYFNSGVTGNSFKWSGIDPNGSGPNYTNFENAVEWTQKVGWDLRGHTLLWGGSEGDNHAMPLWVTESGNATASEVYDRCETRVRREVRRYKGIINEFDVINEPLHATYTQDNFGDSLNWKSFIWAHEENPDAKLYVNDYNVEYGWGDADEYKVLIQDMINRGAPVSGIGMQAHFWDCCRPDVTDFVTQINKLADLGLPMKLTEFDYGTDLTEAEQAEDFIKVMTIAFSHPSFEGVLYWNLSDNWTWRDNSGLFRSDHTPKLAADTLLYLTKELWATNFQSAMDGVNPLNFNAYYGDYLIEAVFDGVKKEFMVSLDRETTSLTLNENDADPDGLDIELVRYGLAPDVVELVFDQDIDASTLNKYDYRVFTQNNAIISDVRVKEGQANVLVLQMDKDLIQSDYNTASYFPGSLKSVSGVSARAFGTEEIEENQELNQVPFASNKTFGVYPGSKAGTVVGAIGGTDPEGVNLRYKIVSGDQIGVFGFKPNTDQLILVNPFYLDFEINPTYELTVEVSDGVHPVLITVTITPMDILGIDRENISISPNPSNGQFTVIHPPGVVELRVLGLDGKQIFQQSIVSHSTRQLINEEFNSGIYIIHLVKADGGKESFIHVIQ